MQKLRTVQTMVLRAVLRAVHPAGSTELIMAVQEVRMAVTWPVTQVRLGADRREQPITVAPIPLEVRQAVMLQLSPAEALVCMAVAAPDQSCNTAIMKATLQKCQ